VRNISREDGFTLPELLVSTTILLIVLGGAMGTLKSALTLSDTATQMADSNQNLRAGANLLVRDLMLAGRQFPIGGLPIAWGAGATAINRPGPPGMPAYTFDNVTATTVSAIVTGALLGPTIDNSSTDYVTFFMVDPLLKLATGKGLTLFDAVNSPASTAPAGTPTPPGFLAHNGLSMTVGGYNWLTGDLPNGIQPVKAGDLIWFQGSTGDAIKTVTSVDAANIYFAGGDWFNFNQVAPNGTLMQLKTGVSNPCPAASRPCFQQIMAYRLLMVTYYVDNNTTPGSPRLTRVLNHNAPQALAGIVEDLDLSYDLVDQVNNPTLVKFLPQTIAGVAYTANQIRKVNMHIGVRSDMLSTQSNGTDYIRNHVSTTISIRDLAFVARYQ
jgi:prepilin-type N-terminal cleavage/methylation domain-containing protein